MTPCGNGSIHIGCMPRSGSSLLRMMLDSHPKISAAPEIFWLQHPNPVSILQNQFNKIIKPGQRYLGKEPRIMTIDGLQKIRNVFGNDFYLICINRNPYDVLISYAKTGTEANFDVLSKDFILGYKKFKESAWSNGVEIRYEDLVKKPQETLQSICDFIHLEFDVRMLRHSEFQHQKVDHYSDRQAQKPLFKSSVSQFGAYVRGGYKPTPGRLAICAELASLLGYEVMNDVT